jgi:hypothetical protein
MLPLLLMILSSDVKAQPLSGPPRPDPQAPPLTVTAPTPTKVPQVHYWVTGKLTRQMAIGGETTGWAVYLDGPLEIEGKTLTRVEIDPAGNKVDDFENKSVEISGIWEKRSGIERGEYWVIVVDKISLY